MIDVLLMIIVAIGMLAVYRGVKVFTSVQVADHQHKLIMEEKEADLKIVNSANDISTKLRK